MSNTGTNDSYYTERSKRCETQSIIKGQTIKELNVRSDTDITITATNKTNTSINRKITTDRQVINYLDIEKTLSAIQT